MTKITGNDRPITVLITTGGGFGHPAIMDARVRASTKTATFMSEAMASSAVQKTVEVFVPLYG